jgi:hypothetical protein
MDGKAFVDDTKPIHDIHCLIIYITFLCQVYADSVMKTMGVVFICNAWWAQPVIILSTIFSLYLFIAMVNTS